MPLTSRTVEAFPRLHRWARIELALLGMALLALGGATAWFGALLVWEGGSWYYLLAGLALALAGLAQITGLTRLSVPVQACVLLATMLWSIWEIWGKGFLPGWGADFGARVGVIAAFFFLSALVAAAGTPRALRAPGSVSPKSSPSVVGRFHCVSCSFE